LPEIVSKEARRKVVIIDKDVDYLGKLGGKNQIGTNNLKQTA